MIEANPQQQSKSWSGKSKQKVKETKLKEGNQMDLVLNVK